MGLDVGARPGNVIVTRIWVDFAKAMLAERCDDQLAAGLEHLESKSHAVMME